jgi:hypothetical protein
MTKTNFVLLETGHIVDTTKWYTKMSRHKKLFSGTKEECEQFAREQAARELEEFNRTHSPISSKVSVWFGLVDYNGNVVGTCPAVQYYLDAPPTDTKVLCKANSYIPRKFVGTAQEAFVAANK